MREGGDESGVGYGSSPAAEPARASAYTISSDQTGGDTHGQTQTSTYATVTSTAPRRVPGAPSPKRRVPGAPSPQVQRNRSSRSGGEATAAGTPVRVARISPTRATVTPSTQVRRVPGAPAPMRRSSLTTVTAALTNSDSSSRGGNAGGQFASERPSADVSRSTTSPSLEGPELSIYTQSEKNIEEFRKRMYGGDSSGAAEKSPKAGWGRLKQRVQWQEGSSCAVCMSGALTGRVKPCGHRSLCEPCYNEILREGRGVYCPLCFKEIKQLLGDSVSSEDYERRQRREKELRRAGRQRARASRKLPGDSSDEDGSDVPWGENEPEGLVDRSMAQAHLMVSQAGSKLRNPSLLGTTNVEIAHAFGSGVGVAFLHQSLVLSSLLFLSAAQLPSIISCAQGMRIPGRSSEVPSLWIFGMLGNCGSSSCNMGDRWYIVVIDAAALAFMCLVTIWMRARVAVFQRQIGDKVANMASRTAVIRELPGHIQEREVENFFRAYGKIRRAEVLTDVEARELQLLQRRREAATALRVAEAKVEWGDPTSECAGECISEEEWGHLTKPRCERRLAKIEHELEQLIATGPQRASAFLWFDTEKDRNRVTTKLEKFAHGSRGGSVCLRCCCAGAASSRKIRFKGMGTLGVWVTHPGLFPANLMHRNGLVRTQSQALWRVVILIIIALLVVSGTVLYAQIRNAALPTAVLLYVVNNVITLVIQRTARSERRHLKTEQNDLVCSLTFCVHLGNIMYFSMFPGLYSSRDGGFAHWNHWFRQEWYDEGGGEMLHYYVVIDAVAGPLWLLTRSVYGRYRRAIMIRKAVCQEQLNKAHTGHNIDFMVEYTTGLVCPLTAVIFCLGLPALPLLTMVGLVIKHMVLRFALFFEASVPLWRDAAVAKWGMWMMQVGVVVHFFFAITMVVSMDQWEHELNGSAHASGLYTFHPLGFIGCLALLGFAKALAPCAKKFLGKVSMIAAPPAPDDTYGSNSEDSDSDNSVDDAAAASKSPNVNSSPAARRGRGASPAKQRKKKPLTMDETLQLLDQQAERAWSSDLVLAPDAYDSFDAVEHPVFGAEMRLRRTMRRDALPSVEASDRGGHEVELEAPPEKTTPSRQRRRRRGSAQQAEDRLKAYVDYMSKKTARRRRIVKQQRRQASINAAANNFIV